MTLLCKVDVAVIGGGIMGGAIAYQLAKAKKTVALLERNFIGSEASGRNGGGVRLQGRHPFEIPVALLSVELWKKLAQELKTETEYRQGGNIWVALNADELEHMQSLAPAQQNMGVAVELLDSVDIRKLNPYLSGDCIIGGCYSPNCGNANPILTTRGYAAAAAGAGAQIFENTNVLQINVSKGEVRGIVTSRGEVQSSIVVVAAGAWTPMIAKMVGLEIPIRPTRDQLMVTEPINAFFKQFIISSRVYFRQAANGGVHIGTVDLPHQTFDQNTDPKDLSHAAVAATQMMPLLQNVKVVRSWAGTTEKTPDDIPILGFVEQPAGLLIAAGFSGHGFALGPAIGQLISELILNGKPSISIEKFHLARFKDTPGGSPAPHWR
jgi:glycine/D-amino acid oxidase-like deaminating enzyme